MALFQDRVAIVTGGASGIGEAVVKDLLAEGAKVVIADFDEAGAQRLAQSCGEDRARAFKVDVSDAQAVSASVDFAVETFGGLHLAVNNAGIGAPSTPLADIAIDDWHRVVGVDLHSVFYGMKYQIPAMLKSGGGAIVNMASILGAVGWAGSAAYVTSKHAVVGITKTAALDYAAQGIRVNAVGPAFVETPALGKTMTDAERAVLAGLHAFDRLARPEEIAAMTSFLLSDRASFMTGTYYPVDGGYLAR
ncbi:SDR family NAD(P)-dependent oxidoreductase [Sphingobium yanoikuyae]|uniref:SDR family NAD(P)-dependent oxidoreductase n=1 Tax=Sphingobium yanoikuyae TaxID=13690 RepID=UPI0008479AA4|nr:SDR family NAD(P)-dependent oxidoreductase [Sphingobium yanoikuyae]MDG2512089.1 SDR family NAD(P)-dependent oxidoreductase [Sphingobium yanoikuyae]